MSDILNKTIVLVLNRHWQAIDVKSPAETFSMLVNGSATALDIKADEELRPVTWEEWMSLPVREGDYAVGTVRGGIRVPTVIVLARFDKVPKRRPKFCARAIWERDAGTCQYTGRKLRPSEGNIDHIIPRSLGGDSGYANLQLLHRHCHDTKTTSDGSLRRTHEKGHIIEERSEANVSCCVLKTSGFRKGIA